jgi:hypothetical protein
VEKEAFDFAGSWESIVIPYSANLWRSVGLFASFTCRMALTREGHFRWSASMGLTVRTWHSIICALAASDAKIPANTNRERATAIAQRRRVFRGILLLLILRLRVGTQSVRANGRFTRGPIIKGHATREARVFGRVFAKSGPDAINWKGQFQGPINQSDSR